MKYNRFNDSERQQKRRREELTRKCFLVFCLWRRNAVMAELDVDDPADPTLAKELRRQWRNLAPDELDAYLKLTLLLSSSSPSSPSSPSGSSGHSGYHDDNIKPYPAAPSSSPSPADPEICL
jgi:hypothetical protein